MKHEFNNPRFKDRRKELRKNQTDAEKTLWQKIRNKQIHHLKFYRQFGVGPYILDFYCPEKGLAIELDGGGHSAEDAKTYNEERTRFLQSKEITVLRFWNHEVLKNLDEVISRISSIVFLDR